MQKRTLKHLAFTLITGCIVTNSFAVAPGFYMGIALGPATNSGSVIQAQVMTNSSTPPPVTTPASPRSSQFGSSIYLGNKISRYGGVEFGIDYFNGISYDTKQVQTCSGATVRVRDLYFAGKGEFSVGNAFEIYGKAGPAYVYQATSGALNPQVNAATGQTCGKSTYSSRWKPTFSIGASYGLSQNWVTDIGWNRIITGGPAGNVDFYGLGISYHFVDKYCGQFLCDD